MSIRARLAAVLGVLGGVGIVVACGSDAGDSNFGSNGGASGSSSGTSGANGSGSGGFGSSGTSSSGAPQEDANPANCKAPIDMFVMFDRSGSMGNDCTIGANVASKWCRAITALSGYFNSAGAKDHAASLQFFPLQNHDDAFCGTGDNYHLGVSPATGYTTLPSNTFDAVLNQEDPGGGGGTPTEAAIRGLTRFTAANRRGGRVTIGILITDGNPNGCDESLNNLAKLLQDHHTATKVRTYVIGMTGATFSNLETIAKGGQAPAHPNTVGTLANACGNVPEPCTFWNVGDGEPAAFEAALAAIQESADGCKDGGGFINPVN